MIIPIRTPANAASVGKSEWLMIELNGELLRPLDESLGSSVVTAGRRVELGAVKFDSDVSRCVSMCRCHL